MDAENRTMYRTRDESQIDCIDTPRIEMGTHRHMDESIKKYIKPKWGLENFRVDLIEDKHVKELFIELANEYNTLSKKLRNIKYRLAGITRAYPFEPPTKSAEIQS